MERDVERVLVSGKEFECKVAPYPWPHGIGAQIDIASTEERVGCVRLLSVRGHAGFDDLAALPTQELCDLALSRFVSGQLPTTIERVLRWQEELSSMGFDYVSPIVSSWLPCIQCSIAFLPASGGVVVRSRFLPEPCPEIGIDHTW